MSTTLPSPGDRRTLDTANAAADSAPSESIRRDAPSDRQARIDLLLAMREHLDIAHHIPGRLRVRANAGLLELARQWRGQRIELDEAIGVIDGIRAARVNAVAASAVIEYDPAVVPPEAWRRLLEGDDSEALQVLRDHASALDRRLQQPASTHLHQSEEDE